MEALNKEETMFDSLWFQIASRDIVVCTFGTACKYDRFGRLYMVRHAVGILPYMVRYAA